MSLRRLLAVVVLLLIVPAHAASAAGSAVRGADISWPNCPKGMGLAQRPALGLPMPVPTARFVIIGLTNGPAFTPNPCLAAQVRWAKTRRVALGAYAVTSYPTPAQLSMYGGKGTAVSRLTHAGAAQANVNIRRMRAAGLRAPMVWVDIEPVKLAPWSRNVSANNAVINGVVSAYRRAGLRVGFYSYAYGWKQITGGRRLPAYPTWVPSGNDRQASALARCGQRSFSGGPVFLGQWTAADRDHNVTCPGRLTPARWRAMFTG